MSRTIFIGDVHGCFDELSELLGKLNVSPSDQVYFVGDLINKGPESLKVISLVSEQKNFTSIMGNHEYEFLQNIAAKEVKIFQKKIAKKHLDWLRGLENYFVHEKFIMVHAGFDPRIPFKENSQATFLNIRKINQNPWHDYYFGDKLIIYGHWAKQGLMVKKNTIGLDSGCVYGNFLSSYILEEDKIIQVKAKRSYCPIKK